MCPTKWASPGSPASSVPSVGEMSANTWARRVPSGSGSGWSSTTTGAVVSSGMVTCTPSILKPSARTEMRYRPSGRVSAAPPAKSDWSPCVYTVLACGTSWIDGHAHESG